jgi:AraC-like DNA-binding protein
MSAQQSGREWRIFNTQYSLAVPQTWQGVGTYRGRAYDVSAGMVFATEPGEVHTAVPKYRVGSLRVIGFDAAVLSDYLFEEQESQHPFAWTKTVHAMSGSLVSAFEQVFQKFGPEAQPMELQSDLVELVHLLRRDLVETRPAPARDVDDDVRVAKRIRECLHHEGIGIDLATLAKRVGVSRFRVLRAFKRHYGVPPHAYQLCVRIASAQLLLKDGHAAADVAAECGFVDQSHMTRHFKRLLGTTPARFALAAGRGGWQQGVATPAMRFMQRLLVSVNQADSSR